MKTRLQDMTSAEVAERIAARPVVLIPMGAQETQGPHAPMGDFVLAERLAGLIADAAGAVVAPVLPFGDSEFYRSLPGCVSLRPPTLVAVLTDIAENFLEHGLDRLVFVSGQSSNAPWIDQAARLLRDRHGVFVPTLPLWRLLTPGDLTAIYGAALPGSQGHGGDPITSMFLHFFPDLLRMDLLIPPRRFRQAFGLQTRSISSVEFDGMAVPMPLDMALMSETGNLSGDGGKATAEIGAASAARIVERAAGFVRHFAACDPRDPLAGPDP